jgi:hypothetical protein
MATGGFVNRDMWMAAAFRKTVDQYPGWRVLIFMGGYHGLKEVGGQVAIGRVHDRFHRWFSGYLADDGIKVYTILTDARQGRYSPRHQGVRPAGQMTRPGTSLNRSIPRVMRSDDAMLVLNHSHPITVLH